MTRFCSETTGCMAGNTSARSRQSGSSDRIKTLLASFSKPKSPVAGRFVVLRELNRALHAALPFVDLSAPVVPVAGPHAAAAASATSLVSACRGLVFEVVKMPEFTAAVDATEASGQGQFELRISRSRAKKHQLSGVPDPRARRKGRRRFRCRGVGEG